MKTESRLLLRLSIQFDPQVRSYPALPGSCHSPSFPLHKHTRSKGPSLPELPGFIGTSGPFRRPDGPPPFLAFAVRDSATIPGLPTDARFPFWHAVLTTPVDDSVRNGCCNGALPRRVLPIRSAFPGLATGRRPHCRFEACSSFTRVTACQIARPPYVDFVAGSGPPVSRTGRPPAIEFNHQLFEWVLPHWESAPLGHTHDAGATSRHFGARRSGRARAGVVPAGFGVGVLQAKTGQRRWRRGVPGRNLVWSGVFLRAGREDWSSLRAL